MHRRRDRRHLPLEAGGSVGFVVDVLCFRHAACGLRKCRGVVEAWNVRGGVHEHVRIAGEARWTRYVARLVQNVRLRGTGSRG